MGDKDKKTQRAKAKAGKPRRGIAGSEIIVALEHLEQKLKKCQSRQKDLKKLAKYHEADSLHLARHMRTLDRQSTALLTQLRELVGGQRVLEQRQEREQVTTGEIRTSLELHASRLEADARQLAEIGSRAQRLESLGQQVGRRAETLERRIVALERVLDRYEERLQACVSGPAQAPEAVIRVGEAGPQTESGSGSGSNVVVFKKQHSGDPGGTAIPSGSDREVLQKLKARLDTVEGLAAGLEAKAEASAQRTGLLTSRIDALEVADAEHKGTYSNQQWDLQDLQLQAQVATEQERILAGKIETLGANWQGLAEATEWQTAQLGELGQETGRLGDETEALRGRTEGLAARLDETTDQAQVLEQRLREVEQGAVRLTTQNQQLQGERLRLTHAQHRLSGGAALLLLLLIGVVAAFWVYRPRPDLDASWKGEIVSLQQAADRYAERVSAQEQRLADLQGRLAGQRDATAGLRELRALTKTQGSRLASQQGLLSDYWWELASTQGSLQQTGAALERLTQEHQRLAADVRGLREQLAEPQRPIGRPTQVSPSPGERARSLAGAEWLGRQDPGHYTIQVVAARARPPIDEVAGLPMSATLAHYRRLSDGRYWHVLIYGSYPSFRKAQEAIAALPQKIQSFGPWIRRFSSVQADLARP